MGQSRARRILARRHVAFLKPFEDRFARVYRGTMRDLHTAVNFASSQDAATRREWKGRVVEAMAPVYRDAMLASGRNYLTKFVTIRQKATKTFEMKAARERASGVIVSLESEFRSRLEETVDTTFDSLEEILTEAGADGLGAAEIDDLIGEEFGDILGGRTDAIATTEMNGAINSVNEYLSRVLAELHTWVTSEDDRVRPTHVIYADAGPQPVGFDWAQLIPDAGYTLRYPCDPECHEPSEVVNCRCFPAPSGEVELPPDEMADYLEDFGMDPEDILLSESRQPVYITNRYTGKTIKGESEGHPFRGNQYTDGALSDRRDIEFRDPISARATDPIGVEGHRLQASMIFSEVKRQLDSPDLPPTVAMFLRERGMKVVYDANPEEIVDPDTGNVETVAGQIAYDPRMAQGPTFTVTASMLGQPGVVGHEIGHLISHAAFWAETNQRNLELSQGTPAERMAQMRAGEGRVELMRAYKLEGGVTPYAQSYEKDTTTKSSMMMAGASEQFAEVEGMFQHVLGRSPAMLPGTRSEKELGFAWALAMGAHGRTGADNFPGGLITGLRFPKTARAWLRHRGASLKVIEAFDAKWRAQKPQELSALFKKHALAPVRKHLRGTEFEHDEATHGSGGDGPSMTEVGRALVGAPDGFNSDPRQFEPLVFGKTQTGEKREAAVAKEMEKFEARMTLRGGGKEEDVKIPATSQGEMKDKMEALFAAATPEELNQATWYKDAAGKTVDELHGRFASRIPGLGKDQVAGILAACSANNVWDDKYGTDDELGGSNQKAAETILKTWADNKPVTITTEDLAMATAYAKTFESGAYKGMKLPEPGTYLFQTLARSDPRVAYLFNTSWHGATTGGNKPEKVAGPGGSMGFGGMPGHVLPSLGLLRGQSPEKVYGGESKVRSFYANITRAMLGEKDPNATIDIWMARAMLDKPGQDGPIKGAHYKSFVGPASRYEGLRRMIAENAAKHGLEPKQYQAVVWYVIRNQYEARERARNVASKSDAAEAKAAAQAAKIDAKRRAKHARQGKLFEKGFGGIEASLGDEEIALAWLQRFLAHEHGVNVNGDPLFGRWDDEDEDAAKAWRATVRGAKVVRGVLTFIVKGDFEGHPFRGNQWTEGHGQAEGDEGAKSEKVSDEVMALRVQIGGLLERRQAATAERDLVAQQRNDAHEAGNTLAEQAEWTAKLEAAEDKLDAARTEEQALDQKLADTVLHEARVRSIDPTVLPDDVRLSVQRESIKAMAADVPAQARYEDLKRKEDSIEARTILAQQPLVEEKGRANAAYQKAQTEREELVAQHKALDAEVTMRQQDYMLEKFYEKHPELERTKEEAHAILEQRGEIGNRINGILVELRATPGNRDPYQKAEDNLLAQTFAKYPSLEEKARAEASISPDEYIREGIARDLEARGVGGSGPVERDSDAVSAVLDKAFAGEQARLRAEDPAFAPNPARAALDGELHDLQGRQAAWEDKYEPIRGLLFAQANPDGDPTFLSGNTLSAIERLPLGALGKHSAPSGPEGLSIDPYDVVRGLRAEYNVTEQGGKDALALDVLTKDRNEAQGRLESARDAENEADSKIRAAAEVMRNEFAVEAGPGYYAKRCAEDDAYYEKQMDEIATAWQHIGGEGPSRIRVATGIGLGLQAGAIYDDDEKRFLKLDDYGDLRNEEETIRWGGAIRREYVETQEDLLGGEHAQVVRLGASHDSSSPSSSSSSGGDDPEETWDDEQKYDQEKLQSAFYESDAASDAESEAMHADFTHDDVRVKLGGFESGAEERVQEFAGRALISTSGSGMEDDDTKLISAIKDRLDDAKGEKAALPMDAKDPEVLAAAKKEARWEAQQDAVFAAQREALRQLSANPADLAAGHETPKLADPAFHEKLQAELDTLPAVSTAGYTQGQLRDAIIEASTNTLTWTEATKLANSFHGKAALAGEMARATFSAPEFEASDLSERAQAIAADNIKENLREIASNEYNGDDALWEAVKDADVEKVLGDLTPKYSSGTLEQAAEEKYRDNWSWDDSSDAFNNWKSGQDLSEYETDEFKEAKDSFENQGLSPSEGEDEEPETGGAPVNKETVGTEKTVKVFRGLKGNPADYVDNFTESWSTSRSKAASFGSTTVMERDIPFEKILVFQGARNWKATQAGGMGKTEFEVMPLSDMPKWYREAYRRQLALLAKQKSEIKG